MQLENLVMITLNNWNIVSYKLSELKKYFYKEEEEPIVRDGITEYDIDRIRGEYNEKEERR